MVAASNRDRKHSKLFVKNGKDQYFDKIRSSVAPHQSENKKEKGETLHLGQVTGNLESERRDRSVLLSIECKLQDARRVTKNALMACLY